MHRTDRRCLATTSATQPSVTLFNRTGTSLLTQSTTGQCVNGSSFWDLGVRGDTAPGTHSVKLGNVTLELAPTYSILTNSNGTSANGQLERRGFANESRTRASVREGRGYAAQRGMRGERGPYARVSEERYGRGWRGERGLYARARVEGGYRSWRGERLAYRDRGVGVGVAAADHGYRTRRLYAYAPTYDAGYATGPYDNYAPGYDVAVTTGPYYTPGWNVAYAGPYYDYAPGVSFGIGIGPVGIGFGPAWGW